MKIFDPGLDAFVSKLERALDVMAKRQQLTASNVANLDTPRYKTIDIDFDAALQRAVGARGAASPLRATNARHIVAAGRGSQATPREVDGLTTRNDGNNVNLDREMMSLAATRFRYEVSSTLTRMKLRQIRTAIGQGRN